MITVYIETNFFIAFAKNQDKESEELVIDRGSDPISSIKIVSPTICFMEALSVLENERQRSNSFKVRMVDEISKLKGDVHSEYSKEIQRYLEQAKIQSDRRINDINIRLFEVLTWAANNVDLINLEPSILIDSLNQRFIPDPTDNLILHSILNHAKTSSDGQKILLTGNSKDFGTKEIKQILGAAGIQKYFASTKDLLGWLRSL
ncbi:MAG TPA: PIN domain-containing protein [Nodularia sp. (in: cyanobacteria)]|nr:PIN domain-containing protein [Nodularia sp. (in: cyanobacteria)]